MLYYIATVKVYIRAPVLAQVTLREFIPICDSSLCVYLCPLYLCDPLLTMLGDMLYLVVTTGSS